MSNLFQGVDALQGSLAYHLRRHNVLSSNIANVDTPGFKAQEMIREVVDGRNGGRLSLAATNRAHVGASTGAAKARVKVEVDPTEPAGPDGNSVSLEREMAKMAANDLRYEGAVKFVSHRFAMLKYAANDGSGR